MTKHKVGYEPPYPLGTSDPDSLTEQLEELERKKKNERQGEDVPRETEA